MRLELGQLPDPDLNPNKRLHWSELSRAKRAAKELAMGLVFERGKPQQPIEKAHITITWVAKNKIRRDPDNLFASMKPYIDGLVASGLLIDDSAVNVSYTIRYERGGKDNTIIEVDQE